MYSRSAAGSSTWPSRLSWCKARAIFPSSQSLAAAANSRTTAQPSAFGPSTSQTNTGTPASRAMLSTLGTVQIRSGSLPLGRARRLSPAGPRTAGGARRPARCCLCPTARPPCSRYPPAADPTRGRIRSAWAALVIRYCCSRRLPARPPRPGTRPGAPARSPGLLQQVGAHREVPVMVAELARHRVQDGQPGRRALGHGRRGRPVERHHRVAGHPLQHPVQGQDLRPSRCPRAGPPGRAAAAMAACSWYSPARPRPCRSAPVTRVSPSVIRRPVPAAALLLGQRDQLAAGPGAGGPPGLGEQHQGQQPGHLGVAGQAGPQPPGQPDGLAGQVGAGQVRAAAGRVALVEQQVEHVQHGPQPARPLVRRRQPERLAGRLEGGLGPADPLAHGRLRHQERGGDLPGGQAADRAQRERDGRRRGPATGGSTRT